MNQENQPQGAVQPELSINEYEQLERTLREQQNLAKGILGGVLAGIVGAVLWAVLTVLTGYQIGYMAIGVGFLVGYAFKRFGKGVDNYFAIAAAAVALLACLIGNVLAICGIIAKQEDLTLAFILSQLTPAIVLELIVSSFSPIDLLFYGLAVMESYKLSVVKIVASAAVKAEKEEQNIEA